MREIAQERWVCDPSRAIADIGVTPEFPIDRGLRKTIAWYREARWL